MCIDRALCLAATGETDNFFESCAKGCALEGSSDNEV